MVENINDFGFPVVLWLIFAVLFSNIFSQSSGSQQTKFRSNDSENRELEDLQKQCQLLRNEIKEQSKQLNIDFQRSTFEKLQTLLANYPTACEMAKKKPDLPAKNLVALFISLGNLLSDWGYETIGSPWEQVEYDPQLHQPDTEDIESGESVYIRFVGYTDKDKILCPAKVSRTLPSGINN